MSTTMDARFLSLTGLSQYDDLIKDYIDSGLKGKSGSTHVHDDRYYQKSEIDTKLAGKSNTGHKHTVSEITDLTATATELNYMDGVTSNVQTQIDNIVNGTTVVSKATSATSAGTANKLGSTTVGSATKPVYINAGVATTCTTYAGGTKLTVNGTNKGGSSAAIFAPTTGGTAGYILKSAGTGSAPVWEALETVDAYTKAEVDTKLSGKSDTSHNHDDKYDAKGASTVALETAKTYTNTKTAGMATTAVVDSKISTHNSSTAAHSDIRTAIAEVKADVDYFLGDAINKENVNALKDTLKEIQTYIDDDVAAAASMTASINSKAEKSDLTAHTGSTTVHVGTTDRTNWNAAYNHSTSTHAPSDAEKNQNAFSNIKVGSTVVAADTTTDTVEFVGSNVTITPDATNDKITFTVANGTTAAKGLVQLTNSVASTSTTTAATPNSVKQAYDKATTAQTNLDTHAASTVHITDTERTTWNAKASTASATTAAAGLMTSAMVTKLNGIATGATKITVDSALSSTSTNPVQNKAVSDKFVELANSVTIVSNSVTTLAEAVNDIKEITSTEIEALFK